MKRDKIFYIKGLLLFIFGICFCSVVVYGKEVNQKEDMQKTIANEIIRLHVIANSDSAEDQALKLKVKDEIVVCLRNQLKEAKNIDEARAIIQKNLSNMESTAVSVMKENGYSYNAKATLEKNVYFPVKMYGDLVFPAGNYEALRIQIGEAEGKNWWCVMFPSLCFVDSTYGVVPDESKQELKQVLPDKEYQSLFEDDTQITVKSKIAEVWSDLWD